MTKSNKGVIVQIDYNIAYILKSNGELVKCPRNELMQVGDVITVQQRRFSKKALLLICVSFVVLLTAVASIGAVMYNTPATYIEVSVNPSVQIVLNRFDRVIEVNALNSEGEILLQGVSYKNLTLEEAQARLLNRMDNNGYLTDATLQFVIVNNSQKKIDKIEHDLRLVFERYGEINNLQISLRRYSNDEYIALEHPLPIIAIPNTTTEQLPETSDLQPPTTTTSSTETTEPSTDSSEPPITATEPPVVATEPPSTTHNGSWNNGWYDWNCGGGGCC